MPPSVMWWINCKKKKKRYPAAPDWSSYSLPKIANEDYGTGAQ